MKLERERWTPLTIVIETKGEAEILHKILGVADHSDVAEDMDLYGLFMALGEALGGASEYGIEGTVTIFRA